jgi:hypothetical protein
MRRGALRIPTAKALAYRAPGAQQADADCRFRPALLFRDLLNLEAFQVVALENHSIVMLAGLENPADINSGQIDFGGSR